MTIMEYGISLPYISGLCIQEKHVVTGLGDPVGRPPEWHLYEPLLKAGAGDLAGKSNRNVVSKNQINIQFKPRNDRTKYTSKLGVAPSQ